MGVGLLISLAAVTAVLPMLRKITSPNAGRFE
jgi:hypothetical protein